MKVLHDLQACQSLPHRHRGIGRYSLSLARAMQRHAEHDLVFALNGAIAKTIEPVRAALPPEAQAWTWAGIGRTAAQDPQNAGRRAAAGIVRNAAFASHGADIHFISSWFEGYGDDVVVDIPVDRKTPVAVTLYDLIPLLHQESYLADERLRAWYLDRVEGLRHAGLLLAISECTRRDAIEHLGIAPERVVNISAAVDERFRPLAVPPGAEATLRRRHRITGRFLLYTGGIDPRKNIERLIEAFARVDHETRDGVQLVIACAANEDSRRRLHALAMAAGLAPSNIVFTGYVSDDDLVALYNLCDAFVFPSWYEGFGLPALEAMACGAAVIGADRASVPEVIGRADALFDPFKPDDIAARITSVLRDAGFRQSLRAHAVLQSAGFSWTASAEKALAAMIEAVERAAHPRTDVAPASKPTLAFVSPLPPERTGIADYASELLPHLARHYRITLVTPQPEVSRSAAWPAFETRDVEWFTRHAAGFDRILYQVGNSQFHCHMPALLERFGGVVVLHDFFLSGLISHLQWASKVAGIWHEYLYRSHGYRALIDLSRGVDHEDMLLRYPCNLPLIENADGVIVHSEHARTMALAFYGEDVADWSVLPFPKAPPAEVSRDAARRELGVAPDEFLVCSFGILGDGKLCHRLVDAWNASSLAHNRQCRLVFVGGAYDPLYEAALQAQIAEGPGRGRIHITGYAAPAEYQRYLQAADIAVQLRQNSRGETSASVFDCMANGRPTIVNAHGSMAELPPDSAVILADAFTRDALKDALETLHADASRRDALSVTARAACHAHDPERVAALYRDAIEREYERSSLQQVRVAGTELASLWQVEGEAGRAEVAEALANNLSHHGAQRQLLVDATEMVRRDAKSGIQRVVRSILLALLEAPPDGYRVEPVYADPAATSGYRYARELACSMLGIGAPPLPDEAVEVRPGDVFVGLDLALAEIPENAAQLQRMRDFGAAVHVVVYDLLPLAQNEYFPPHAESLFRDWLAAIANTADGAICISRAVADELLRELDGLDAQRHRPLQVGFFHLGADLDQSLPTRGVSAEERTMLEGLENADSFLMVGTIEPRKGHAQAIAAFELLWSRGGDQRLVILGRPGWMTEELTQHIVGHAEFGRRLLWFQSATDEVLELLYARCTALLAASEGEGFGLPLIEAARHGLPILARDLAVFREVAGEGASYFSGFEAEDLADAIDDWCARARAGAIREAKIPWLTWEQSARMLVAALDAPYATWSPGTRRYLPAHDTRHQVAPGHRGRGHVRLPAQSGLVMRTRAIALPPGDYQVLLLGELRRPGVLRLSIDNGANAVEVAQDDAVEPAHAIARCRFHLDDGADALALVVHCDGESIGAITALVIEAIGPPGSKNPASAERTAMPAIHLQ